MENNFDINISLVILVKEERFYTSEYNLSIILYYFYLFVLFCRVALGFVAYIFNSSQPILK